MTQLLSKRILDGSCAWFLRGLPSLNRANAMFRARKHTMTSLQRCRSLWGLCRDVLDQNVPGAFVECGVWRGGSAAVMGLAAKSRGQPRSLHLFDSFQGLPEPSAEDGGNAAEYSGGRNAGQLMPIQKCIAGLDLVKEFLFQEVRLSRATVQFHVGWFQDTVPAAARSLGSIAVLRLDGDWYASTVVCLEYLYPLLRPGGVIILDDYSCWEGCKKATDEYRQKQNILAPLIRVDDDCCYWVRPGP